MKAPKRTPEEMAGHYAAQAEKANLRLARARDPLIFDLEHMREDLRGWIELLATHDENGCLESAAQVIDGEIKARTTRAIATG